MVDLRLGRVEVFSSFGICLQHTAAESQYLSRERVNGKHYPAAETVEEMIFVLYRKACFYKKILLVAVIQRTLCKAVAFSEAVSDLEFLQGGLHEAAFLKI